MHKLVFSLFAALLLLAVATTVNAQTASFTALENGRVQRIYEDLDDGALDIMLIGDPSASTITVEMTYTGTSYLAFAFSDDAFMPASTAVIGVPGNDTPQIYQMTGYSMPVLSDAQTLTDASLVVTEDGVMTMRFTKKLEEAGDVTVALDADQYYFYAYLPDSTAIAYHGTTRTVLQLNVLADPDDAEPAPPSPAPTMKKAEDDDDMDNIVFEDLGDGRFQQTIDFSDDTGVELELLTNVEAGTISVKMSYVGTSYLAFAFSEDRLMPGSIAVIAEPGVADAPRKFVMNDRSMPVLSDQQTLVEAFMSQEDGVTTMQFKKLLEEPGEPTVSTTDSNFFLYAVSEGSNTLRYHGSTRYDFSINLTEDLGVTASAGIPNQGWWTVHGLCMGLAWVVFVPLGVASSLARKYVSGPPGTWFKIHRTLNGAAVLLTVIGFIIAVALIQNEQGDTAQHFSTLPHHRMGLIIFILAVLQGFSGVFRPHAPAPPAEHTNEDTNDGNNDDDDKKAAAVPADSDDDHSKPSPARKLWEYQHKIMGTITMIMGWYNSDTGLEHFSTRYETADWTTAMWTYLVVIALGTLVLGILQRTRK